LHNSFLWPRTTDPTFGTILLPLSYQLFPPCWDTLKLSSLNGANKHSPAEKPRCFPCRGEPQPSGCLLFFSFLTVQFSASALYSRIWSSLEASHLLINFELLIGLEDRPRTPAKPVAQVPGYVCLSFCSRSTKGCLRKF